jgi:hypothetical protein
MRRYPGPAMRGRAIGFPHGGMMPRQNIRRRGWVLGSSRIRGRHAELLPRRLVPAGCLTPERLKVADVSSFAWLHKQLQPALTLPLSTSNLGCATGDAMAGLTQSLRTGYRDGKPLQEFKALLRRRPTIIEVGAHDGSATLGFQRLFPRAGAARHREVQVAVRTARRDSP